MSRTSPSPPARPHRSRARRLHWGLVIALCAVMTVELVFTLIRGNWINVFLILGIMATMLAPLLAGHRFQIHVPSEFQILAIVFVFASLFLGEVRGYYHRLWWWDIALHTSSGLLLGIFGFLLVYVLNENRRAPLHMQPRFVALFACCFAIAVGAVWEIFEFSMDRLVGTQMQKPMAGDPSGLTDTMWDLVVDSLGAIVISLLGWWYMVRDERSFIERWIHRFIELNPRLFTRGGRAMDSGRDAPPQG